MTICEFCNLPNAYNPVYEVGGTCYLCDECYLRYKNKNQVIEKHTGGLLSSKVQYGDDEINCPICNSSLRYIPHHLRKKIKVVLEKNHHYLDEYNGLFGVHLLRTNIFLAILEKDELIHENEKKEIKEILQEKWKNVKQ